MDVWKVCSSDGKGMGDEAVAPGGAEAWAWTRRARGGAGLQRSTTSGQGGPMVQELRAGEGEEGGMRGKTGNKIMLGTGRMHQDTENALMHRTSSLPCQLCPQCQKHTNLPGCDKLINQKKIKPGLDLKAKVDDLGCGLSLPSNERVWPFGTTSVPDR